MDKVGKKTLEIMKNAYWYNNWLYRLAKPHLKGQILEIGAGVGNFTKLLVKDGRVTAIDINKKYVGNLKKIYGRKVNIGFGDIERGRYFFKNKTFDSIVCLNVLEHIKNDKKALNNIYNLLKPGARLLLLVPAHRFAFGPLDKNLGHIRRYSKNSLTKELERIGFKIKVIRYINWIGLLGWLINVKILRRKVLPKHQVTIFDKIARPFLFIEKFVKFPFGLSVFVVAEK